MSSQKVEITLSKEDYEFLRFQGIKLNMNIPSVIKKLVLEARNIDKNKNCNIGLSGITVSTTDTLTSVSIKLRNKELPKYDFNKINIYHALDSFSYKVRLVYPDTLIYREENESSAW